MLYQLGWFSADVNIRDRYCYVALRFARAGSMAGIFGNNSTLLLQSRICFVSSQEEAHSEKKSHQ